MAMLYKYTPGLMDPDILQKTFKGRESEIKDICRILESAATGNSMSHPLLIGPRGMGKTHILRVIYNALKGDTDVEGITIHKDNFIPVIFAEEEYPASLEQIISLIVEYLKAEGVEVPEEMHGIRGEKKVLNF